MSTNSIIAPTSIELTTLECGARYERCTHYAWFHVPSVPRSDKRPMRAYIVALPS